MSFAATVDQHYVTRFVDEAKLVVQQTQSKLRALVRQVQCSGESQVARNLFKEGEYIEQQGRTRSNVENPIERSRRWHVIPNYIATGEYLDTEDKFRAATDAQSPLMMAHGAIIRRGIDDRIVGVRKVNGSIELAAGGILGQVAEGKSAGAGLVSLPAAQQIAAAATGLTTDKLAQIREGFAAADYDLDMETPVMAITAKQNTDLLKIVEAAGTSINLAGESHIIDGKVKRLYDINFVETQRLPLDANGDQICPAWMPSNIELGIWSDYEARAWNDSHSDNLPYINIRARMDCVRVEDVGVFSVACQIS